MKQQSYVGFHAISAILASEAVSGTLYLHGHGKRLQQLEMQAQQAHVQVEHVDRARIEKLGGAAARGAVLIAVSAAGSRLSLEDALRELCDRGAPQALVLVLDHITDPQNLGAILRSADQFGVDFVVLPQRRSAGLSDAVLRTSCGAAATVRMVDVANLARALQQLKSADFWIYGADMQGNPVDAERLDGRVALVLGSEGSGLSRLVREQCDVVVRIPTGGTVDSLNVSVSAGVFLYEITRQQRRFR
ncbi:MAG: 23S rRNA (guanosine(2251)-2'-O)-methyltransferase RlmB [Spirochaetaceae bacterium]|nr:MAG: 23S rRNA (guanosine(2251)-2'-O)-methyltransferase RlmB [Spirochaetaceae bacterium]